MKKRIIMSKILVGMSGGVDSAVTAYLLKAAGHEVIGITLKNWESRDGEPGRCCEIDEAHNVAMQLDISYYAKNSVDIFKKCVIEPFVSEYLAGRTPNPCVICNRMVKWNEMIAAADTMGAEYIATGHYAIIEKLPNGRITVKQAEHAKKDQTYMLYRLSQEQLARTIMPLGKLSKEEVRHIAETAGLSVASKPDSQEICFVPDGDYAGFIEEETGPSTPGNFVDEDGKILGTHKGIIHYTVGQRKGLGIALGTPAFVKEIRVDTNEVVIAPESSVFSSKILVDDLNFLSIPNVYEGEPVRAKVRIRYHHAGEWAVLERIDAATLKITFDAPVRAVSPGQSAVFYDEENRVVGGGIIKGRTE